MMADKRTITRGIRLANGQRLKRGDEDRLAKAATKEEVAHLTSIGAISGYDGEGTGPVGATAATATEADTGATRKPSKNDAAVVRVGRSVATAPAAGETAEEDDVELEDMSRKQLLARAEKVGLDVNGIDGTGKDGYVTMSDMIRALEAHEAENGEQD